MPGFAMPTATATVAAIPTQPTTDLFWLQVPCTNAGCWATYLTPRRNAAASMWGCPRCPIAFTYTQLAEVGRFDDQFATRQGVLQRGVTLAATYTYATPDLRNDRPAGFSRDRIYQAADLRDFLSDIRGWDWESVIRTLHTANTEGTAEHVSAYGLRTVITRNSI